MHVDSATFWKKVVFLLRSSDWLGRWWKTWVAGTHISFTQVLVGETRRLPTINIRTLRNYDGDDKENVKKSNRFNEQNNNSARASPFFVHFVAVPAQLRPEMTNFLAELSRAPADHYGK